MGSDDTMMEKPRMHGYRSSTFMSNGGLTTISMDEEKLHKPPLHERRNKKNQDPTTGPNAYHSITDSQFGKLQKAISKARSPSDFDKLENIIKNGQIPSKNWHGKGNNYNPKHQISPKPAVMMILMNILKIIKEDGLNLLNY